MTNLQINEDIQIPELEFSFDFSRSSKPGGQNVNKVNTRVTLKFNILQSPSLTPLIKQKLIEKLGNRINKNGVLQISSQRHRTQHANKLATIHRFQEIILDALIDDPQRTETKIPKAVKLKWTEDKRRKSKIKQLRNVHNISEDD